MSPPLGPQPAGRAERPWGDTSGMDEHIAGAACVCKHAGQTQGAPPACRRSPAAATSPAARMLCMAQRRHTVRTLQWHKEQAGPHVSPAAAHARLGCRTAALAKYTNWDVHLPSAAAVWPSLLARLFPLVSVAALASHPCCLQQLHSFSRRLLTLGQAGQLGVRHTLQQDTRRSKSMARKGERDEVQRQRQQQH